MARAGRKRKTKVVRYPATGRITRASRRDLDAALFADNLWGLSAIAMIGSGLIRALGSYEKGSAFYLGDPMFQLKMVLVMLVLALEIWPMVLLLRARFGSRETVLSPWLARISWAQLTVVLLLPVVAAAMARGTTPW